jgi:predicted transcriptional regulator
MHSMNKTPISIKLDSGLLSRLDAEAERRGQTRTRFVELAIEHELEVEWSAVRRNPDGSTSPMAMTRTWTS